MTEPADWAAIMRPVAQRMGPDDLEHGGEALLRWVQEWEPDGPIGEWHRELQRALGLALLDEATYARGVLDALAADDEAGEWITDEQGLQDMIARDLDRFEAEHNFPDHPCA